MGEVIQGLWIGDDLSLMERVALSSFVANGHPFHLYAYEPFTSLPKGVILLDASEILPRRDIFTLSGGEHAGSLTAFSNLFRFTLLAAKGGWWVDLDVVCLQPFTFGDSYVMASEYDEPNLVRGPSSAVLRVPPGDVFIRDCLEESRKRCVDVSSLEFGDNGFKLVREMVAKHGLERFVTAPHLFAPVSWWEVSDLVEPRATLPDLSQSYAVHLYNEMWRLGSLDKNLTYSARSLYGSLARRYA